MTELKSSVTTKELSFLENHIHDLNQVINRLQGLNTGAEKLSQKCFSNPRKDEKSFETAGTLYESLDCEINDKMTKIHQLLVDTQERIYEIEKFI